MMQFEKFMIFFFLRRGENASFFGALGLKLLDLGGNEFIQKFERKKLDCFSISAPLPTLFSNILKFSFQRISYVL